MATLTDPSNPAEPARADSPMPGAEASPAQIQADIDATRELLGETIEELADKADVKYRAKRRIAGLRRRLADQTTIATSRAQQAVVRAMDAATTADGKPDRRVAIPAAAMLAVLLAGTATLIWRRHR
ncbi:MAG: DUF3618 domain-containing protein [Intrasporangium sp.]|uniref:DUF3618 domain-containing protein n=1 Tax=Intrasporangium sp. TaxID=1925024 RepID=UPI002649063E|nr:DUF3618 domain-containing protein [Intrasporangium sp.]MDN5797635.1 DUF3618 domain-containing protein [Intrasporangium sp.]